MGKAARWFRGLLGLKKEDSSSQTAATTTNRSDSKPAKKRWSFVKSYREKDRGLSTTGSNRRVSHRDVPPQASGFVDDDDDDVDPNKHAIAVAAATAAVAEAAVAAAQAAAAVVRLTSSGRSTGTPNISSAASCGIREEWASAVKIQSHFRAYLSRRALRALKALVKLQALVRGHIVRKQTADMLRRMQALLRAQSRARAGRIPITETPHSSTKSSQFFPPGPATPEKFENAIRTKSIKYDQTSMLKRSGSKSVGKMIGDQDKTQNASNWVDRRVDEGSRNQEGSSIRTGPTDDEKSDKILEIDTVKHFKSKTRSHSLSSHHSFTTSRDSTTRQTLPSPSSCEVQSLNPLIFADNVEETSFCTADNSPQFYSASSKGGSSKRSPFAPSISDGSRSYLSGYSDYPNYMSYTESSRAKVRSLSAPKQRPQFERSSSTKRYSVHGYGESRSSTLRVSTLQSNFASKAYPGSGRLDRLGMPIVGDSVLFNGGNWNRN